MSVIKIEKGYSRLINEPENCTVSIKLTKALKNPTAKQIKEISEKLLKLQKVIVDNEIKKLKKKEV